VKVLRAEEVAGLASRRPGDGTPLDVRWLEGPANSDRLDVGLVTVAPGGSTPPHVHLGGQVIVVLAGEGYVEAGDQRVRLVVGDVVITPPGELHTHGAAAGSHLAHLTVTTAGYEFPDAAGPGAGAADR
jgi:quercetin dioxygenase-like cupin family protein